MSLLNHSLLQLAIVVPSFLWTIIFVDRSFPFIRVPPTSFHRFLLFVYLLRLLSLRYQRIFFPLPVSFTILLFPRRPILSAFGIVPARYLLPIRLLRHNISRPPFVSDSCSLVIRKLAPMFLTLLPLVAHTPHGIPDSLCQRSQSFLIVAVTLLQLRLLRHFLAVSPLVSIQFHLLHRFIYSKPSIISLTTFRMLRNIAYSRLFFPITHSCSTIHFITSLPLKFPMFSILYLIPLLPFGRIAILITIRRLVASSTNF